MSNQAMEEKIRTLSADYIYQQAVGSLLLLLLSAMEDTVQGTAYLPYPLPPHVLELKDGVRAYLLRLEELLDSDPETRADVLEDALAMKDELLMIYETVYSYFSQWNLLSTQVSDQIALRRYKADGVAKKQVDWSLFFADCHAFLESAETRLQQKSYIGQLLKCIPLSMTRDAYFDVLEEALEDAFAEESATFIDRTLRSFLRFCCPKQHPRYGEYFPEIAKWIDKKLMLLPHKFYDETLSDYYEELRKMFESLEEIEEHFSCVLHDINSIILLFYLTYRFEDLTEEQPAYVDLYHTVCAFISDQLTATEMEAYWETLMEQLELAVEPVIDRANTIAKEEYALLQQAGSFEGFSEDTKKVLLTEEFIRECYYGDLNDQLFQSRLPEDLPPAQPEDKYMLLHGFLKKTRDYFDTLPAPTRKLAMQNLLGALPPVYSVHDVMEMLMDAVDRASTPEQKLLIVDKVGMVFLENGWQSIAKPAADCGCGHDHDHHSHDCGCGHDHHHHDHDCGCGHDHHEGGH